MKTVTTINYPDVRIALRDDLYDSFRPEIENFFTQTKCRLFTHTIHKNYDTSNHSVSSLGSNSDWLKIYWSKYRNDDLLEKTLHHNIAQSKLSFISHNALDVRDPCMEERHKVCDIQNGLSIATQQDDVTIETMSFGWKDFSSRFEIDKIFDLCHLLTPLRDLHFARSATTFF